MIRERKKPRSNGAGDSEHDESFPVGMSPDDSPLPCL